MNYQNDDMKTYTNLVKFRQNKNCGFVLKPKYLLESSNFNPLTSNNKNCKEAEPTIYKIKVFIFIYFLNLIHILQNAFKKIVLIITFMIL